MADSLIKNYSATVNGSKAIILERLIVAVNVRWCFAHVPVTRRGKILPFSEINLDNNAVSL